MPETVEEQSSDGHRTGFLTAEVPFRAIEPARFFLEEAPQTASARAYLRQQLPAIYQEQDFTMRFVGALEGGLDPIIAILDSLPAYFDGELAPQDVLEMLTAWLGIELDETQSTAHWRRLLGAAMDLGRTRGTRRGMELILELVFPDLEFRVADDGGITYAVSPEKLPEAPKGGFVVYCDTVVSEERMPTIARVVEAARPVHVPYRLRFRKPKTPKKPTAKATEAPKPPKRDQTTKAPRQPQTTKESKQPRATKEPKKPPPTQAKKPPPTQELNEPPATEEPKEPPESDQDGGPGER